MPELTEKQVALVAEIVFKQSSDVASLVSAKNDSEKELLIEDTTAWYAMRGKHANLDGEIKLRQNDKRNEIIQRVSGLLGVPYVPYESRSVGGSDSISRFNVRGGCWY